MCCSVYPWFGLMLPVNNFSVMLGRSHRFLGITSNLGGGGGLMSCKRTQNGDPSGLHAFLSSACVFFQYQFFQKNLSGITSVCQTVWIKIRPDVCKGYHQTTLAGKVLENNIRTNNIDINTK